MFLHSDRGRSLMLQEGWGAATTRVQSVRQEFLQLAAPCDELVDSLGAGQRREQTVLGGFLQG